MPRSNSAARHRAIIARAWENYWNTASGPAAIAEALFPTDLAPILRRIRPQELAKLAERLKPLLPPAKKGRPTKPPSERDGALYELVHLQLAKAGSQEQALKNVAARERGAGNALSRLSQRYYRFKRRTGMP